MDSAAVDFKRKDYPITMRAVRIEDGEKVWEEVISDPPVVVRIPPLAGEHGPVRIEIELADGTVEHATP